MKATLNRLRIGPKLSIIALLGMSTMVLPLSLYLNSEYQNYRTTSLEAYGLGPATNVLDMLQDSQKHRGLSAQTLGGHVGAELERAAKQKSVEQLITKMETAFAPAIANEKIKKEWSAAVNTWKALADRVQAKSLAVEQSFQEHTSLSQQWLDVLEQIRNEYQLSLDPKVDGYYLHTAGLLNLPALSEALGQARAKGTGLLTLQQISEADRALMISLLARAREYRTIATRAVQKVYEADSRHMGPLFTKFEKLNTKLDDVFKLTEDSILKEQTLAFSPAEYFSRYTMVIDEVFSLIEEISAELKTVMDQRLTALFTRNGILLGTVFLLVLAAGSIAYIITRNMTKTARQLSETVERFGQGNDEARTKLTSQDELGQLGNAFDRMMDDRVMLMAVTERERAARLAEAEAENESLNNSIVTLMQAVAQLSQKDLTIRVPVAEDVTGPMADALNMLSEETAQVLAEVTRISEHVANASRSVKVQSDAVMTLAEDEREQVADTAEQLAAAAEAMNDIAALAQTCNTAAEAAINRTQTALETVTHTVEGISTIRDTIRETEKRIKRLGERSQEIGGAVDLINGIAERTHILALNASMHAASAGEAGRGFAVVADEVQRLAENARQSTEQISQLVKNIQTETMDAVTTMNTVISQVVDESRLAGQAGEQMRQTQQSTAELVASVRQIAIGAQTQAKVSNTLRDRAGAIVESTRKTSEQLTAQGGQTTRLLEYASRLVRAVRVFKLPAQSMVAENTDRDE